MVVYYFANIKYLEISNLSMLINRNYFGFLSFNFVNYKKTHTQTNYSKTVQNKLQRIFFYNKNQYNLFQRKK